MKKWLLAASILFLSLCLTACAHRTAAYGYGGGAFPEGCDFGEDCYAGPQYTCVFYQPPTAPARLAIAVARQHGSPRVLHPREGLAGGTSGPNPSFASNTGSMPAPPPVARAPVVMASPSSGGRAPQTRD